MMAAAIKNFLCKLCRWEFSFYVKLQMDKRAIVENCILKDQKPVSSNVLNQRSHLHVSIKLALKAGLSPHVWKLTWLLQPTRKSFFVFLSPGAFVTWVLSWLALTANFPQPVITWEEYLLIKEMPRSGWPVGISVGITFLIDIGNSSPLWGAPFPNQEVLTMQQS